jgi:hypothetical protein
MEDFNCVLHPLNTEDIHTHKCLLVLAATVKKFLYVFLCPCTKSFQWPVLLPLLEAEYSGARWSCLPASHFSGWALMLETKLSDFTTVSAWWDSSAKPFIISFCQQFSRMLAAKRSQNRSIFIHALKLVLEGRDWASIRDRHHHLWSWVHGQQGEGCADPHTPDC